MRPAKTRGLNTGEKARREFLKGRLGVTGVDATPAYALPGTDRAAERPQASENAGTKDAENVVGEMRQTQRPPISVHVHAHCDPPAFDDAQKEAGGFRGARQNLSQQ